MWGIEKNRENSLTREKQELNEFNPKYVKFPENGNPYPRRYPYQSEKETYNAKDGFWLKEKEKRDATVRCYLMQHHDFSEYREKPIDDNIRINMAKNALCETSFIVTNEENNNYLLQIFLSCIYDNKNVVKWLEKEKNIILWNLKKIRIDWLASNKKKIQNWLNYKKNMTIWYLYDSVLDFYLLDKHTPKRDPRHPFYVLLQDMKNTLWDELQKRYDYLDGKIS